MRDERDLSNEWDTAADGYSIGAQIATPVSARARSYTGATVIALGACL